MHMGAKCDAKFVTKWKEFALANKSIQKQRLQQLITINLITKISLPFIPPSISVDRLLKFKNSFHVTLINTK